MSVNLGLKHKIRSHLFNSYLPNTHTYIDTHRHKRTNNELKRLKKKKKIPTHHTQPHWMLHCYLGKAAYVFALQIELVVWGRLKLKHHNSSLLQESLIMNFVGHPVLLKKWPPCEQYWRTDRLKKKMYPQQFSKIIWYVLDLPILWNSMQKSNPIWTSNVLYC